jgi:virginiamycin B lyase
VPLWNGLTVKGSLNAVTVVAIVALAVFQHPIYVTIASGFAYVEHRLALARDAAYFSEYPLPGTRRFPHGIAAGPDGALWFTEFDGNRIGRIATDGAIREFALPAPARGPAEIALGPDGALWFTEFFGNRIGRLTPSGALQEFPVPTRGSQPVGIAAGRDRAVWFSEFRGNAVGRVDPRGAIAEFRLGASARHPQGLSVAPDGAVWFTEANGDKQIGRMRSDGTVTEFRTRANHFANRIALGPDGTAWFTVTAFGAIGSVSPNGTVATAPGNWTMPEAIAVGPDRAVWFTAGIGSDAVVVRFAPTGGATSFPYPAGPSVTHLPFEHGLAVEPDWSGAIARGSDGAFWFTEPDNDAIGRIVVPANAGGER